MHHPAHQWRADDRLGAAGGDDQPVEIDAGFDAELMAEKHRILGANVAGGAAAAMIGEGAAAQPGDGTVEQIHPHGQRRLQVGNPEPAGIVNMHADAGLWRKVAQGSDHPLDAVRISPAHSIGKYEVRDGDFLLRREV